MSKPDTVQLQTRREQVPWRFMLPLVLGTMMNPLNSTMLATALITLCSSFHINLSQGAVLIVVLYVTSTIAQPLMGRLADLFSAKKINTLGFVLVLAATLTGIFAPGFNWLILSRVLLGLGTSAAYPSAIALINRRYAEQNRPVPGNVLGIIAIASQVSAVLGPTLGGLLTETFGWRGIFFVNVPWAIAGMLLARNIPACEPADNQSARSILRQLDIPGILLFSAFLLALLLLLLRVSFSWPYAAAALTLMITVAAWERRQESPFIDVRLLYHNPALSLVYLRTLATNYLLYLLLFSLPQWLQGVKHMLPARAGLVLMPMTAVAIVTGYIISKIDRPVCQNILGVGVMLMACLGIFLINAHLPVLFFIGCTLIVGLADGVNMIANQSLLNREAPPEKKGVSFGLYRTAGYIGAIASGTQLKRLFHGGISDAHFHQTGYYALAACILLLALLIPLIAHKRAGKQPLKVSIT